MGLFSSGTEKSTTAVDIKGAGKRETNVLEQFLGSALGDLRGMDSYLKGGWEASYGDMLGEFFRVMREQSKKGIAVGAASGMSSSITGNYMAQALSGALPALTSMYGKRLDMPFMAVSAKSQIGLPEMLTGYFQRERLAGATTRTSGQKSQISLSF